MRGSVFNYHPLHFIQVLPGQMKVVHNSSQSSLGDIFASMVWDCGKRALLRISPDFMRYWSLPNKMATQLVKLIYQNAFIQMLNFHGQNIACHYQDVVAENGYKFNYDQCLCNFLCPRPGYSVERGLVPRSTVLPLTMLGWSIQDDWAPGKMSLRGTTFLACHCEGQRPEAISF